ncbi:hypothetical protein [Sulfuriferula thiophila]|nr:hypothetical protein [Sulfuriferula thiophila]
MAYHTTNGCPAIVPAGLPPVATDGTYSSTDCSIFIQISHTCAPTENK